jgi:methyl-accepting chemotaxis protein
MGAWIMAKLVSMFNNFRIGTKLFLGFAIVILISIALNFFNQGSLIHVETSYDEFSHISHSTILINNIETSLLTLAISMREYMMFSSEENYDKIKQSERNLSESINSAKKYDAHPDRARMLEELSSTYYYYNLYNQSMIGLMKEKNKIINDYIYSAEKNLTDAMDQLIDGVNNSGDLGLSIKLRNIESHFLVARLYLYKFLTSHNEEDWHRIALELKNATAELERVISETQNPLIQQRISSIVAGIPAYRDGFGKLDDNIATGAAALTDIVRVRKSLLDIVAAIRASQEKDQAALQQGVTEDIEAASLLGWSVLGVALIIGTTSAFGLTRAIAGAVRSMTQAMEILAKGDTTVDIPARGRGDEIGAMAEAVQIFKDNAIARIELEVAQTAERAAKEQRASMIERLIGGFNQTVTGILRTVASAATELDSTAQSMAAIAEEASRQASASAAAAGQTSANVQAVASAAEEMAGSLEEIAHQVTHSTVIANRAVQEAEQTNGTVQGLAEAAQKIGDVVNLISNIASQTNLLALNATIEAARAGEAGKGFAVVASEVKNLATQTAKATDEISAQIAGMQTATGSAVGAIQGIGGIIREMNDIATTIAAAVEEQAAATGEISRNVTQAATGTREVSSNIGQLTEASGQTGAAAGQVRSAAGELAHQSEMLRTEVERFLVDIQAA